MKLTRHWRAFFLALAACALGGLAIVAFVPRFAGIFLLMIYCIPSNSVFPIPHEPAVLYFAKYYHPFWVAMAGTIGTVVVSFADYALVEAAMGHPRIAGAREKGLFKWALKWMARFPFWIIVLFSFTPLPISVVRILAPAAHYPLKRYVAALIVGRFPRFYALAWLGHTLVIPTWALVMLMTAMVVLMWLASRNTSSVGLDDEDEPGAEDAEELSIPDLSDPEHPRPAGSA
jgi:membrane protein YqaA with SNARE-associated domain